MIYTPKIISNNPRIFFQYDEIMRSSIGPVYPIDMKVNTGYLLLNCSVLFSTALLEKVIDTELVKLCVFYGLLRKIRPDAPVLCHILVNSLCNFTGTFRYTPLIGFLSGRISKLMFPVSCTCMWPVRLNPLGIITLITLVESVPYRDVTSPPIGPDLLIESFEISPKRASTRIAEPRQFSGVARGFLQLLLYSYEF